VLAEPIQTTLELGVPLSEVTFCAVDLETTGGSPREDSITEIGAVTYRGGERLGSFQSLVNPGQPIPPYVAHLTGIDDRSSRPSRRSNRSFRGSASSLAAP
jgi:DNA polymerase-3 subunit epsilon